MKLLCLGLLLAPLLTNAQAAPVARKLPPLYSYYDGTINGKLPVHFYFFATNLFSLVHGVYHYGQHRQELRLLGAGYATDSLGLEEYTTSDERAGTQSGIFRLQRLPDGSLRGTWRASTTGARLPVLLHPVAVDGPATCAPVRVLQRSGRPPELATPDKQAAATFSRELQGEEQLNEGDPGTEQRTLTYASRGLVSLLLVSEMQGASVYRSVRWATFDGCTGHKLLASNELDPSRLPAFLQRANQHLHQELEDYITERGPQGPNPLLSEEDIAGLRRQEFALDPEQFRLDDGQVIFPYAVSYNMLSDFVGKEYVGRFGAAFSFEELQPFLRPASPLRRLVLTTPVRAASAGAPKPSRKPTTR